MQTEQTAAEGAYPDMDGDAVPAIGTFWTNSNGDTYEVTGYADMYSRSHQKTPPRVIYRSGKTGRIWSRVLSDWYRAMKPSDRAALATKPAGAGGAVTDEQIIRALHQLHAVAFEYDRKEYGLPLHDSGEVGRMVHLIRSLAALTPPAQAADSTEPVAREQHCRRCGMQGRDIGVDMATHCTYCGIASPDERPIAAEAVPPASSAPAGWKLVPLEPTEEMLTSGWDDLDREDNEGDFVTSAGLRRAWAAMLKIAPEPEAASNAAEPAGGEAGVPLTMPASRIDEPMSDDEIAERGRIFALGYRAGLTDTATTHTQTAPPVRWWSGAVGSAEKLADLLDSYAEKKESPRRDERVMHAAAKWIREVLATPPQAPAAPAGLSDACIVQEIEYARDHGWPLECQGRLVAMAEASKRRAALAASAPGAPDLAQPQPGTGGKL